jgi:uridine kinase
LVITSMRAMTSPFRLQHYFAKHAPKNGRFHTIAIDGRAGSGKSSLSRYLLERYPTAIIFHGDNYNQARGSAWFGAPNEALLRTDVFEPLQRGNTFASRHYDWKAATWTAVTEVVVSDIFCAEACFAFEYPLDWDVRLWVDVSRAEALARAVTRETAEHGWETPDPGYLEEWRQWQLQEDAYIARVDPARLATTVLDGSLPWTDQLD